MKLKSIDRFGVVALLILTALSLSLSGCGGSGNGALSSQVVGGVASVGATLAGQVSLKDASAAPQVKTAVIGNDGTYAIDVTGMKAPYILQAPEPPAERTTRCIPMPTEPAPPTLIPSPMCW